MPYYTRHTTIKSRPPWIVSKAIVTQIGYIRDCIEKRDYETALRVAGKLLVNVRTLETALEFEIEKAKREKPNRNRNRRGLTAQRAQRKKGDGIMILGRKIKIYVASSWRNKRQQDVVSFLRSEGFHVYDFKNPPKGTYFSWAKIDPNWEKWTTAEYFDALKHPLAIKGFNSDFAAMKDADACVLLWPSGRSSHLEGGWFAGAGRPLITLTDPSCEPELMVKMGMITNDIKAVPQLLRSRLILHRGRKREILPLS